MTKLISTAVYISDDFDFNDKPKRCDHSKINFKLNKFRYYWKEFLNIYTPNVYSAGIAKLNMF